MPVRHALPLAQAQGQHEGPQVHGCSWLPCPHLRGCTGIAQQVKEHMATVVPRHRLNSPLEKKINEEKTRTAAEPTF